MVSKNVVKPILDEVLNDIRPDSDSLIVVNDFVLDLNNLFKEKGVGAVAVLGGSVAKGTFLKGDYDADIFVKFDISYKGKDISNILADVLNGVFVFDRVKGSRDYFHVRRDFVFELVPVLDVSSIFDAENVIDMSPLHVDYFLSKGDGLQDEVRLLKRFMKSARVYGSESFIKGFSGHVVDLLVLKFGGFLDVLKAASKWTPIVVIDLERKLKDPLMELDKAKVSGPLVVVDPVQENRNAAAALSFSCFDMFVIYAKDFLASPSKDFFRLRGAKEVILPNVRRGDSLFEFVISPVKGSDDISGSKVLKILEFLSKNLVSYDFDCSGFVWDFNFPCKAYFSVKDEILSDVKVVRGPPVSAGEHCVSFRDKHDVVFEENDFLFARIKRKFVDVSSLFHELVKDAYVRERCKSIKFEKV
jgi:tRNA nucleotidyltransferase (CCA-adding enzyme)